MANYGGFEMMDNDLITRLNGIIYNQREKLRELEETRAILRKDKKELIKKIEQLEQQREQAVTLIKDGRFVEALQLLEGK